jgi:hypothetical protein
VAASSARLSASSRCSFWYCRTSDSRSRTVRRSLRSFVSFVADDTDQQLSIPASLSAATSCVEAYKRSVVDHFTVIGNPPVTNRERRRERTWLASRACASSCVCCAVRSPSSRSTASQHTNTKNSVGRGRGSTKTSTQKIEQQCSVLYQFCCVGRRKSFHRRLY